MIRSETLHSVPEQLIQGVYAREVFCGQGVKVVHRTIRTLWVPRGGAGLYSVGLRFLLARSSDEIPR